MALFKISKGLKANLPSAKTAGYCWYTVDDSLFYTDYEDANGVVQRKALNAKDAEKLAGASLATILNSSDIEIPTSKAVLSALEGKANASHTHDDRYYTETEINTKLASKSDTDHDHDGVYDAAGAAATVQQNLNAVSSTLSTHTGNSDIHVTTDNKTNWNAAYTHSTAAHAPSNAEKNQNAFSNIAVSGQTTVAADTATDTVTFVGSNVTITTDATNDKVTFTVADGSTNSKGVVQLTNSTSSTSTTTAATPSSVKSAYDLANTAKTNAATAQTKADSAYDLAENVVYVGPTAPTDPNVKVWINTAEEGTGVVPVLPRVATITLSKSAWSGSAEPYSQPVSIATVTTSSKIDLQPSAQQIVNLQNAETSLMIENNSGTVTCYAIGNKPIVDYTMQVLIQEVAYV